MSDRTTTIQIEREAWRRLNQRKRGPDDTFDDVIKRLIDETDESV